MGRARALPRSNPLPPRRRGGGRGGAAPVGGRRDLALAPTEAAGCGGTRPGGTKCLRSDFDGSGRTGGSGEPPTIAATPTVGQRVAAATSFPTAETHDSDHRGLDTVGLIAGHAPPTAPLGS